MVENGLQVTRAWRSFFSFCDYSARLLIILMASASHERQENPSMHEYVKNWVSGLGNGATHCLHYTFVPNVFPKRFSMAPHQIMAPSSRRCTPALKHE
jgi:hypothetical protein